MKMKSASRNKRQALGLRERKKAKTRAAIQWHALRLFRDQGYGATTVEQIAEAAEVSPSTFYRYFPTKEDVVLWDNLDPIFIEAYAAQPAELGPIRALRGANAAVWAELSADELAKQRERMALLQSIPELRARMLEQFIDAMQLVAKLVAERLGRPADDFAVRNMAGALIGVGISVILTAAEDPSADIATLLDAAFAHLEAGLPL